MNTVGIGIIGAGRMSRIRSLSAKAHHHSEVLRLGKKPWLALRHIDKLTLHEFSEASLGRFNQKRRFGSLRRGRSCVM